jgi:hypothetical protein
MPNENVTINKPNCTKEGITLHEAENKKSLHPAQTILSTQLHRDAQFHPSPKPWA